VPKTRFSHHSLTASNDAGISKDQTWVNCRPKGWRSPKRTLTANASPPASCQDRNPIPAGPENIDAAAGAQTLIHSSSLLETNPRELHNSPVYNTVDQVYIDTTHPIQGESPATTEAVNFSSPASLPTSFHSAPYNTATTDPAGYSTKSQANFGQLIGSQEQNSPRVDGSHTRRSATRSSKETSTAIDHIQESCLLRYFTDELSAWVGELFPIS
jgi:hypothetical protein